MKSCNRISQLAALPPGSRGGTNALATCPNWVKPKSTQRKQLNASKEIMKTTIRKVVSSFDPKMIPNPQLREIGYDLLLEDWTILITEQTCGWCSSGQRVVTFPTFIFKRSLEYQAWYFAHEFSHALVGVNYKHGPVFMAKLIEICPKESLWHETGYKARNAIAAGISHIRNHSAVKIGGKIFHINEADLMDSRDS